MPAIESPVDLCNLALSHLGERLVASMDDDTTAAEACRTHYGPSLESVLRSHRWNFATRRSALSRLAEAPAFGWSYAYALPPDCLRILEINGSEEGAGQPWLIEGRDLLSDETTCNAIYIARVEDVTLFDALFVEALSLRLAVVLAEKLRGSTSKAAELEAHYERVTAPLARRIDANEARRRKPLRPLSSPLVTSRKGAV